MVLVREDLRAGWIAERREGFADSPIHALRGPAPRATRAATAACAPPVNA